MPGKLTGAAVRRIRKGLGLSQVKFAELLRMHPNSLARIERNEIGMRGSTIELIRRIEAAGKTVPTPPTGRPVRFRSEE